MPSALPTLTTSAAMLMDTSLTPGVLLTAAEPKPVDAAIGFAMLFTASFAHRSPQMLRLTFVGPMSFITSASACTLSVGSPFSSPSVNDSFCGSPVCIAFAGSYSPAPQRYHARNLARVAHYRRDNLVVDAVLAPI